MDTLREKENFFKWERLSDKLAAAASLPAFSGDGYGYGGGAIVVIGSCAISFGEGSMSHALAEEVARRWNAHADD